MHPKRHTAFTLIELLVCVAIIALLLAILLPSLAKARDQARGAVCMSQQKQLATAHIYYSGDNRGSLPHYDEWLWSGNKDLPDAPRGGSLFGHPPTPAAPNRKASRNYAVHEEIYKCPSDMGRRRPTGPADPLPPTFSYTRNQYVLSATDKNDYARAKFSTLQEEAQLINEYGRIERPKRPSDVPLLLEEYELSPMNDGYFVNGEWDFLTERHGVGARHKEVTDRHSHEAPGTLGRGTIGYYDGHVLMVRSQQFNQAAHNSDFRHALMAPGLPKPTW